jgi:hypothetical protein
MSAVVQEVRKARTFSCPTSQGRFSATAPGTPDVVSPDRRGLPMSFAWHANVSRRCENSQTEHSCGMSYEWDFLDGFPRNVKSLGAIKRMSSIS